MKREDVSDCDCNMHARRYFVKALDGGDERAALVIGAFKGLYQVEEEARHLSADAKPAVACCRSSTCCFHVQMALLPLGCVAKGGEHQATTGPHGIVSRACTGRSWSRPTWSRRIPE